MHGSKYRSGGSDRVIFCRQFFCRQSDVLIHQASSPLVLQFLVRHSRTHKHNYCIMTPLFNRVEARIAVHFHTCELEARAQDQKLASARHTQHGNVEGVRQTPQTSFRGKPKLRNSGGGYRIGMIGFELHTNNGCSKN